LIDDNNRSTFADLHSQDIKRKFSVMSHIKVSSRGKMILWNQYFLYQASYGFYQAQIISRKVIQSHLTFYLFRYPCV